MKKPKPITVEEVMDAIDKFEVVGSRAHKWTALEDRVIFRSLSRKPPIPLDQVRAWLKDLGFLIGRHTISQRYIVLCKQGYSHAKRT